MSKRIILGVSISNVAHDSCNVHKVLSKFSCDIRTRLGLHCASCKDSCKDNCKDNAATGLIIIEFVGGNEKAKVLTEKLTALPGVVVKSMKF